MIYRTNWIPRLQRSFGSRHFLFNSLMFHSAHRLYRTFVPRVRNPRAVASNYDLERSALSARLDRTDWITYTEFAEDLTDFFVVDDRIKWGSLREPRQILLQRLVDVVAQYVQPGQTVIEFGSGDGRNLLYLKRRFPDVHFIGLELSQASVDLSFKAAEKFGVQGVTFIQSNVCEPLPDMPLSGEVGLIYSSFALEQMPRIFADALANMMTLRPHAICLFEPVPELWGSGLRAWVARLHVRALDRLRNLPAVVQDLLVRHPEYKIVQMKRSGIAINPHTEMCQVVVLRAG